MEFYHSTNHVGDDADTESFQQPPHVQKRSVLQSRAEQTLTAIKADAVICEDNEWR
jgi:hypothetical protein